MKSTRIYQLLILLSLVIFILPLSFAVDTLTQGQVIKDGDGEGLRSAGDVFEFGFFTPGNSTYRYAGVFYRSVPVLSVVWVANRKTPLDGTAGSIAIAPDGNLAVLDDEGATVWSTDAAVGKNDTTAATIKDSGQLVLSSATNGTVLWDSFDHPTDTFLPGMKLSLNRRTGRRTIFRAWKSPNDPSPGKYSLGLDPAGSGQIFIWKARRPRWRSGQWDNTRFIGSTMRALYLYGFKLVPDPYDKGSMYFTYTQVNISLLRFVMQWDGVENTTLYDGERKVWKPVWVQPVTECETYAKCGSYGICSDGGSPICSCLRGFVPRSEDEWRRGNWSAGCVRRSALACLFNNNTSTNSSSTNSNNSSAADSKGDGFYGLQGVKVPDKSDWDATVENGGDCRSACLNNCSCKAYAQVSGIGCLTWGVDLIDVYQFPQGSGGGTDFYVKLAGSELGGNTKTKIWKAIVISVSAALSIMIILCILSWWKWNAAIKDCWKRDKTHFSSSISMKGRVDLSGPSDNTQEAGNDPELPLFTFDFIASATSNFDESNKLGEGGFGDVYKGLLPGGQEVAVKRLSRSSGQGQEEFKNEMILIAKLQHRNLVRLLGCCIQGEEKMLVYEYMPNKSLDAFLFDPTRQELLDWKTRYDIIEGIARGLVYLHRDSRLRIIHRDLKASNILLDGEMKPKISDFGMARIFGRDQNQGNTTRVVGTFGYMSPEYAMEGLFSGKSDVYSFGVLVLEIVSGRRNNSFHNMTNIINIVGYAWRLWTEARITEMVHPTIEESCSMAQVLRCIHVGLLCVQDHANDRPDMQSVVLMLASEAALLPTPKPPTFALERSPNRMDTLTENAVESYDVDDRTITVVIAR
ncbi:G-type lectin S-receptor-like serine/threonine-protein kinase B120 [Iris pallida]|uniref:Receptor-like serine/threonine-protein kinase n=1 Tax=Iris pallida TaxID=29817 RepID=A0AAX6GW50_IRIPA|nr:G-type lectin S-receptor-like serine/threonine-protein kinase B120 [Iris pallida]KAJ6832538.1 G-type lectin S-receptor-like serine/threonine-protein kinase B120 [Iris pallida]